MINTNYKTHRKVCGCCGKRLAIRNFHKRTDSPDGLQYYCKRCSSKYGREFYEDIKYRIKTIQAII
jgi:hypothetical protein